MRANFLVHWTGKDISTDRDTLTDDWRRYYVERLRGTLLEGLWMMVPSEKIEGTDQAWIKYDVPMTCFTEVKLSETEDHTRRYGLLGLAVDRLFVLDRYGGPVHYVRNGVGEKIVGYAAQFFANGQLPAELEPARNFNTCFLKMMSNKGTDDFEFLDEHEWRIVYTDDQEKQGTIRKTDVERPLYKIPFQPHDLKFVVFPDLHTRALALKDPSLRELLICPCLTIEECLNF
jgi:hypothetical protein